MRRVELTEARSRKFWSIAVDGAKLIVRSGGIGTNGEESLKELGDAAAARAEAERLIRTQLANGYRVAAAGAASAPTPAKKSKTPKGSSSAGRSAPAKLDLDILGAARRAQLEPLVRPATWLRTIDGARSQSHFGGVPKLPSGLEWPVVADGRPMSFVARIVLSEVAHEELPKDGELLFFVLDTYTDVDQLDEYASEGRVMFLPERDRARARAAKVRAPKNLMRDGVPAKPTFSERQVSIERVLTLPASSNRTIDKLKLSKKEVQAYDALWTETFRARDRNCHQLLGHRHRAYDRSHKATTRPLLQVRSDPSCGMVWGAQLDDLCFMIDEKDLRAARFDKAFPYLGD